MKYQFPSHHRNILIELFTIFIRIILDKIEMELEKIDFSKCSYHSLYSLKNVNNCFESFRIFLFAPFDNYVEGGILHQLTYLEINKDALHEFCINSSWIFFSPIFKSLQFSVHGFDTIFY